MSFFIFPQKWIAPAIAAAALAFGPVKYADDVHITYRNLPPQTAGQAWFPDQIRIDKRPASEWPRDKAMCVIVHEYGHLARGNGKHSSNPRSIMYHAIVPKYCRRWLHRHHLR